MVVGKVVRFDEGRGYGFITPDDGGDDVFVHANELTARGRVGTGARVRFNVIDGERGPKAYDVQVLEPVDTAPPGQQPGSGERHGTDDELCEVFSEEEFRSRITEILLDAEGQLTGAQILGLRQRLLQFGKQNRWVD